MFDDLAPALRDGGPLLVTGAAGFIGHALSTLALDAGAPVVGLDNLCPYYDPALKAARLDDLQARPGFRFVRADLADRDACRAAFEEIRPRLVAHLAAQAGVRHSIDDPAAYVDANLVGFANVLEACRRGDVAHLVYASSSSVYGGNRKLPFAVGDPVDRPVSFYAATKRANELMAHAYSHLYGLPTTGLRFFTVYGPWGRPDMAYWKFAEAICDGRPIDVYNEGRMARDFTYVDDAASAVARLIPRPPVGSRDAAPFRIFNIGNTRRETLTDMIGMLEEALGRSAEKRMLPMQPGDVVETWADVTELEREIGYRPATSLRDGLARFVAWYLAWRARPPTR